MALVSHKHALDAPTSSFAKIIQDLLEREADSVAKEVEEDRKCAQQKATKKQKSVATSAASADTSGTSKRRGRGDSNGLTKKQRPPKNASKKRRMAESTSSGDPVKKQKQSDIRSFLSPRRSDGPGLARPDLT